MYCYLRFSLFNAVFPGTLVSFACCLTAKGFIADFEAADIDLSEDYTTGVAQGDFNRDGFPDIIIVRSAFQTTLLHRWYNFSFDW